jgi:hypothetical protein
VSPDGARCGLTCRSAVARMAGCGLAWPHGCGRWLPVWLPEISLAELTPESQEAGAGPETRARSANSPGQVGHRPGPGDDSPAPRPPGQAMTRLHAGRALTGRQLTRPRSWHVVDDCCPHSDAARGPRSTVPVISDRCIARSCLFSELREQRPSSEACLAMAAEYEDGRTLELAGR